MLLEWKGFRRMYIYAMTENMKAILRRWSNALFTEEIRYAVFQGEKYRILTFDVFSQVRQGHY